MKNFKKYLFVIAILICIACPVFTGCTFLCFSEEGDYGLVIYPDSKAFSWKAVRNATKYEIYCNDELIDTADTSECIFEFGPYLTSVCQYDFSVKAITTGLSFTTKQVVQTGTYNNTEVLSPISNSPTIKEGIFKDSTNIEIKDSIITFDKILGIDNYILGMYSNSLGYREYEIDPHISYAYNKCTMHLSPTLFNLRDEITAIRILVKVGDNKYAASPVTYYNPDNYTGYTDNIYIFDGKIYDHYINTLDELQNIIYHSFVYRDEDFNIKLSSEMYDMATIFDGGDFAECLDLLIFQYGFGAFSETSAYMAGNIVGSDRYFSTAISTKDRTYNIKVTYMGVAECDIDMESPTSESIIQEASEPYYDTVDYTMIGEEYGNSFSFASDHKYLSTVVTTTEELYWAVENGVTPIFTDTECRGYKIYNQAKSVLGKIISTEMTDFEKVLSIFDWICVNTVYDYDAYGSTDTIPTKYPCYYLEGVFTKGIAVCDGFSKAFSLMCNMLDIEAIRIVGIASDGGEEGGHAWNKVLLDKDPTDEVAAQYYIVDITWTEIFSSAENEILSHRFFLIDDDMIEYSHADFEGREEFRYLPAKEMYGYYEERKFSHGGETYDFVIDKDEDFEALFEYMFASGTHSIEMILDLDYLVSKYEANHNTTYNPLEDITITNFGNVYYVALKNDIIPYLRETKNAVCNELYIFMVNSLDAVVYNEAGDSGLVYSFTQRFLIDADGEIADMVEKLENSGVRSSYEIYVDNNILDVHGHINYITRINELFSAALEGADIEITFDLKQANVVYDEEKDGNDVVTKTAAIYTMTVADK